jgi:hypothetical protein
MPAIVSVKPPDFDEFFNDVFVGYSLGFNSIVVSLEEAQKDGVDISSAPAGSLAVLTSKGYQFVMPEDLP